MAPPRREALIAGGLALALWVALCLPFIAEGPVFYRDLSQNLLPVRQLAKELRESGAGTAWNPYLSGGTPLDANPNSLLLHPGWQFDRLMPSAPAIKLSIALHILLAGTCLALWLTRRGASVAAAATGGALLACSGPMLSLGTLPNLLAAACWIPAALLALELAREGRRWAIPAAVFSGACCLIPADPVSAATLVLAVCLSMTAPPDGLTQPVRLRGRNLLALFFSLSICAALVQWLPAWSLVSRSERGAGLTAAETLKWSLSPARVPELFVSRWTGDPTSLSPDRYWGAPLFETGLPLLLSITFGVTAILLAGAGLAGARNAVPRLKRLRTLGALLSSGGLLLAFGRHVPFAGAIAAWLPGASLFRYPEKFFIAVSLGIAILAALGVDRLSSGARPRLGRGTAACAGAVAVLAFGLSALGAHPPGTILTPEASVSLAGSLRGAGAIALGAALILWLGSRGRMQSPAIRIALLGLVVLELLSGAIGPPARNSTGPAAAGGAAAFPPWGLRLNPTAPALFLATSPILAAVGPILSSAGTGPSPAGKGPQTGDAPAGRTVRLERPDGFELKRPDDRIAWGFLWDRISLARSWPAGFRQPTAFDRPTDRLLANDVARAARVASGGPIAQRVRLWSLAGASAVTSFEPLVHPGLVETGRYEGASHPPLVRYENREALPAARLVHLWETRPGAEAALSRVLEAGFDPAAQIVIEDDTGLPATGAEAPGSVPEAPASGVPETGVRIIRSPLSRARGESCWVVAVESSAPALLALEENWDPGWKATVDGKAVPALRANGFLMAVPVPRGKHEVIVEYRPGERTAGFCALALAAGLSLAAAFAFPPLSTVRS